MEHTPTDLMFAPTARCLVYRLPNKLTNGYCFDGGHQIPFFNVDWFDFPTTEPRETLVDFVKSKRYFDTSARFLILADHADLTFTIEPGAKSAKDVAEEPRAR